MGTLLRLLLLGLCLTHQTLAAQTPPPPPVPPPPIMIAPPTIARADYEPKLLKWVPGAVQCGGEAIQARRLEQPLTLWVGYVERDNAKGYVLRFRINAEGRAQSISAVIGAYTGTEEIAPALAASTFEPRARSGCQIRYSQHLAALSDAPIDDVIAYSVMPTNGQLPREAAKRIAQMTGNCMTPPMPAILNRAFPDFQSISGTPGIRDWSMVRHDIDKNGRPINIRIMQGTGNAKLEKAALAAVSKSRFAAGARTGCLFPYWRAPETIAAPAMIDRASLDITSHGCPAEDSWATPLTLTFPPAFQRRAIEGWAIIAYDLAPWGATGNVRILASEPAEGFGNQAAAMIRNARKPKSALGASGCIARVRYVMPKPDQVVQEPPLPIIIN